MTAEKVRYEYDPEADAVYIYLSDEPYGYGVDLDPERRVDFSQDRTPIGVELRCLRTGVDISGLPMNDRIAEILEEIQATARA